MGLLKKSLLIFICIISGIIFTQFSEEIVEAQQPMIQKFTYPKVGTAFLYSEKASDISSQNQIQSYIQERLKEIESVQLLKNYLPETKGYLLDLQKDVTVAGSTTYLIEELSIPTTNLSPSASMPAKRLEFETISSETGKSLPLSEIFNNPQQDYPQFISKLTEKISTSTAFSENMKQELLQQLKQDSLGQRNHYQLSNDAVLLQFLTKEGTAKIGLTKDELRRSLQSTYMTAALNQKVANEIQQEEAARQAKEEELRKIQLQVTNPAAQGKVIALTFDDGPDPAVTPRILATLAKYKAKATFFVLGRNASAYANLVQQEVADGHEIGNHSWSHPDLTSLPKAKALEQVNQTNQTVLTTTGYQIRLLRPPYGAIKGLTADVKMPIAQWSVDTLDWKTKNPEAIYQEVMRSSGSGSVVLMHDIHPTTADALDRVLSKLSAQGYRFVTVSELFGTPMQEGVQYFNSGSIR